MPRQRAPEIAQNKMTPDQQPDVRCILENINAKDTPENRLKEKEKELKSYQIGTLVLMAIILGLLIFISYR
jgi:hypothetical protein